MNIGTVIHAARIQVHVMYICVVYVDVYTMSYKIGYIRVLFIIMETYLNCVAVA